MTSFCSEILKVPSISPAALNLQRLHHDGDTTPTEPILLITTPGADPSQEVEELAEKTVGFGHYTVIAMGQGQQDAALNAVKAARKSGDWVFLKNLHLAVSWIPILEKELNSSSPHQNFRFIHVLCFTNDIRLWLTAEPHPKFSTILLQSSTKITYEAPPG